MAIVMGLMFIASRHFYLVILAASILASGLRRSDTNISKEKLILGDIFELVADPKIIVGIIKGGIGRRKDFSFNLLRGFIHHNVFSSPSFLGFN